VKLRTIIIAVVWLCLGAPLAILLGSFNVPRFVSILSDEASVMGTVTDTNCDNHATVHYSFEANGRVYRAATASSGDCRQVQAGHPLRIYYAAHSPIDNAAVEPWHGLLNEIMPIILAVLLVPPFIIWRGYKWQSR
jgi:hypothetical protein